MDPSLVTSTILAICSALLGLNIFFLKNLIGKIEASSVQSNNNQIRMELLEEQVSDIKTMREDVAVLKYAIIGALKNVDKHS